MSLGFPNTYSAIVEDKVMSQEWLRYFQQAHDAAGFGGAKFPLWSNDGMIPALMMLPDNVSPPGLVTFVGAILQWGFDAATQESLHATARLRSGYETGTALRPYISWAPTTVDAGVVRWGIEAAWYSVDSPASGAATYYLSSDASGTVNGPITDALQQIDGDAALGPGSMVSFRVFRDSADGADTYPADAILLAAGFVTSNNATGTAEVKP